MYTSTTISSKEIEARRGKVYRFYSGVDNLAAGTYITMSGITPPTGTIIYTSANINKSGDEVIASLIEEGTYVGTGAFIIQGKNLNRSYPDQTAAYPQYLGSSTLGTTITGGITLARTLISGTGLDSSQVGGLLSGSFEIYLKPNTRYTLKVLSVGACKISIGVDLIYEQL